MAITRTVPGSVPRNVTGNAPRTTAGANAGSDSVVLLPHAAGIALIPKPTALTRLNYFDGKFLRASDLQAEQQYHLELQRLATRAGGSGVVHGFELQAHLFKYNLDI